MLEALQSLGTGGFFGRAVRFSVTAKSQTDTSPHTWTIDVDGRSVKSEQHVSGDMMTAGVTGLHLGHHDLAFSITGGTSTFDGGFTFEEPVGSGVTLPFQDLGGNSMFKQGFQVMPLGFVLLPGHGVGIIRGRHKKLQVVLKSNSVADLSGVVR